MERLLTKADFAGLFPSYLWIDIEASSLSADSWPIEFGWCSADLRSQSFLIRPLPKWNDWSAVSEGIHGISLEALHDHGIDPVNAAKRINSVCAGRQVLSDNPQSDGEWMHQLFHDVGIRQEFSLQDSRLLESMAASLAKLTPDWMQSLQEQVKAVFPHPHRAGPDARCEAARFLALALPEQMDAILALA
jgi:hypothetical protein